MTNLKRVLQELKIQAESNKVKVLSIVCRYENGDISTELGTYSDIEKAIQDIKDHNRSKGYESNIQIIDIIDNEKKMTQEVKQW